MSIIQEALRRKEEMETAPAAAPPPMPRGLPPPEDPPPAAKKRKGRAGMWVAIVLGVLLVVPAGVGAILLGVWWLMNSSTPGGEHPLVTDPVPLESASPVPAGQDPGASLFVPVDPTAEQGTIPPEPDATPTLVSKVAWPEVRVSAIMAHGGGIPGTVNINGTLLGVGDTILGIRVVRIDQGEVLLEYEGARRLLRAGQTTAP